MSKLNNESLEIFGVSYVLIGDYYYHPDVAVIGKNCVGLVSGLTDTLPKIIPKITVVNYIKNLNK